MRRFWKEMTTKSWFQDLMPRLTWFYVNLLTRTLRFTVEGEGVHQQLHKEGKPIILACWHGDMLPAMYVLRQQGIYVMASTHRDGRFIAQILKKFGWNLIYGSAGKEGLKAFLELIKRIREGHVTALTPDGPTGPVNVLKQGVLQAARKTGAAIIPLGVAAWPKKNLRTWDSFMVPNLGGKAVVLFGDPIYIEKDSNQEEMEKKTAELEAVFASLKRCAEQKLKE